MVITTVALSIASILFMVLRRLLRRFCYEPDGGLVLILIVFLTIDSHASINFACQLITFLFVS
jgi:hypothetical protein